MRTWKQIKEDYIRNVADIQIRLMAWAMKKSGDPDFKEKPDPEEEEP